MIYGHTVWKCVFGQGRHQFSLRPKLLSHNSVMKCRPISHTHSLHEQISGSIVRMNMFCVLWMLCCFCMSAAGFRQCALCLLLGNGFFHSTSKLDSLGCSWIWKKSKHRAHLYSHVSFRLDSNHCHLSNDLLWVFYWTHFTWNFGGSDFFCLKSVIKIKQKIYSLFII